MKTITTKSAPAAIGPYSQAVESGGLIFCSGQIGLSPAGELAASFPLQVKQCLNNLQAVLKAANCNFENVLKVTVFLTEIENFQKFNEIYSTFFANEKFPAREVVGVAALPKGAQVEISLIASTCC